MWKNIFQNDERYVYNIFTILSQQIISSRLLLVDKKIILMMDLNWNQFNLLPMILL